MSEIRVTNVIGENGSDPVGLSTGFTVGPTSGTTATITHEGQASFTGIVTATSFVPTEGQLSHRNIIINGDFRIAQRGSSSTDSGIKTVDRFSLDHSGTDEAPTQAQVDVAAGTTPYELGFRKAFKVTNGNQTSGAGAGDFIRMLYYIEAQDLANSGWNYKSSSSYITLSFWVKSSVAQTYYTNFRAFDGTQKMYYFSYTLSANTWTKVTHTIPGHADISFDNDTGQGMYIQWYQFRGTNNTGTVTANQWHNLNTSTFTPDQTTTWYTTNDATFEITGVQLEVGPVATPFEHRSYADELRRCQRYYYKIEHDPAYSDITIGTGHQNGAYGVVTCQNPVPMRTKPSITVPTVTNAYSFYYKGTVTRSNTISLSGNATNIWIELSHTNFSGDDGAAGVMRITNTSAYIEVHSEL